MGVYQNISYDKYPKQSSDLGKEVIVCFNYDTSKTITGKIIRDDIEEPGLMLIQLSDGRIVRSVECQYRFGRD